MNGMCLDIIAMAYAERHKHEGMKLVTLRVTEDLPYVVLPGLVAKSEGTEAAYFLMDKAVPVRKIHWACYPELNALEGVFTHTNGDEQLSEFVRTLGEETHFEVFGAKNLLHTHYNTLLATLLVRESLRQFMNQRVKRWRNCYNVERDKSLMLTEEELVAELKIFIGAAQKVAEFAIQKRYDLDMSIYRQYCYKAVAAEEDSPIQAAKLKALMPHENPSVNLSKDKLGLDGYNSQICGENLQDDVMKFLSDAYNKVYAVI